MGMLSRGAELQVPDLWRLEDGTGIGSIYGRRSEAEWAAWVMWTIGL
jgi:hypothetical protein